jgi:glutamyl-tRNA reductase
MSILFRWIELKKADAEIRGRFSLDTLAKTRLLEQAKNEGIESLIVTSTCNRTENLQRAPFN